MKISVVMACYNYGRYLSDAVGSLLGGTTSLGPMRGQTLQDLEIVIVDDASTDNTERIGGHLAEDHEQIRYIRHGENLGTAEAYNTGAKIATGQYLTMLSADDMRESWSLEALVSACENNLSCIAYDDIRDFADGHRLTVRRLPGWGFEAEVRRNLLHAGIVYPRKAWEEVGGYAPEMADGREEWAFGIALALAGWKAIHIPKPGYLYRTEGQNRSLHNSSREHVKQWARTLGALYPEAFRRLEPKVWRGQVARRDWFREEGLIGARSNQS